MIEIILAVVVAISSVLLVIAIIHAKFKIILAKTNEAELHIGELLQKKYKIMIKFCPIIEEELKLDKLMKDIDLINEEIDTHKINNILNSSYDELFKVIEDHEKLLKSKKIIKLIEQLHDNEDELIAAIKFYNDSVILNNKLTSSFPSNIIKMFFGYKSLVSYRYEKREIFEILKDKGNV